MHRSIEFQDSSAKRFIRFAIWYWEGGVKDIKLSLSENSLEMINRRSILKSTIGSYLQPRGSIIAREMGSCVSIDDLKEFVENPISH